MNLFPSHFFLRHLFCSIQSLLIVEKYSHSKSRTASSIFQHSLQIWFPLHYLRSNQFAFSPSSSLRSNTHEDIYLEENFQRCSHKFGESRKGLLNNMTSSNYRSTHSYSLSHKRSSQVKYLEMWLLAPHTWLANQLKQT